MSNTKNPGQTNNPKISVNKKGAKRVRGGHLWIYKSDLVRIEANGGDIVTVVDEGNNFIGRAFYSDRSEISLRIFTTQNVTIDKDFWKQKGIDENELNISDGSGLSPQNRITTHAQVEILKYAKSKAWFLSFYNSLPEYNGMKIKSGTIKDVKGYCGYHKAKDGKEYIFSFLVNNYNGPSSSLVNKMYKVLDVLK